MDTIIVPIIQVDDIVIGDVRLESKTGGKSDYAAPTR